MLYLKWSIHWLYEVIFIGYRYWAVFWLDYYLIVIGSCDLTIKVGSLYALYNYMKLPTTSGQFHYSGTRRRWERCHGIPTISKHVRFWTELPIVTNVHRYRISDLFWTMPRNQYGENKSNSTKTTSNNREDTFIPAYLIITSLNGVIFAVKDEREPAKNSK
jgi:hypothetical protein